MKKSIAALLMTGALSVGGGVAVGAEGAASTADASAANVEDLRSGAKCLRRGVATLRSLGIVKTVALEGLEVVGVGRLSLATVLRLHVTDPELFQTGGVTVVVPGVGEVPATWCDGV